MSVIPKFQENVLESSASNCFELSLFENLHIHNLSLIVEFLELDDKKTMRLVCKRMNQRMIILDKIFLEMHIQMPEFPRNITLEVLENTKKDIYLKMHSSDIPKLMTLPEDVLTKVVGIKLYNADIIQGVTKWKQVIAKLCNIRHLYFRGERKDKVPHLSLLIEKFGASLETLGFSNVRLEDMKVPVMESLKELNVYGCSGNENQFLENVTKDLEHFEIMPCALTLLDLNSTLSKFQALKFLSLVQGEEYNSRLVNVPLILEKCSGVLRLETLSLCNVDLSGISRSVGYNLQVDTLSFSEVKGNAGVMHLISENSKTLMILMINSERTPLAQDFKLVTGDFSRLRRINLFGSKINCSAVKNLSILLSKCQFIRKLDISDCELKSDPGLCNLNVDTLTIGLKDETSLLGPGFTQLIQASMDYVRNLNIAKGKIDDLVNLTGKFKCLDSLLIHQCSKCENKPGLNKLLASCAGTIRFLELMFFEDATILPESGLKFPMLRQVNQMWKRKDPLEELRAMMMRTLYGGDFGSENSNTPDTKDPQFSQIKKLFEINQQLKCRDWKPLYEKCELLRACVHVSTCPCHEH